MTAAPALGPVGSYVKQHFRHFNAAALVDAAEGYRAYLAQGGKMMVTLAGAMSTAELGLSFAEMIRQDKVHLIVCTGANLEEDIFNLVAHDFYERVPHYRDLTPQDEAELLGRHMNRVTDTCIPEMEAMRRMEKAMLDVWTKADQAGQHCVTGEIKNVHTVRTGIEYMTWLAQHYQEVTKTSTLGMFQIGGGIAGDFPICVVPMLHQDLELTEVPLWGYFCQISDSTTSYGSYSGAVPNEKITWGKLGIDTPKFIVESDATIVAPLIFAYLLGW